MNTIDFITQVALFEGLTPAQREMLTGIARRRVYGRGQALFSEGDEAAGFHVVLSGRVKVFKLSPDGKEQILQIFGPGEPVGEVAVFSGQAFPASADAYTDAETLFFPRAAFVRLIAGDPSLSLNMLAVLSKRLRMFTGVIESLSLKEVPGRLASYLLLLSARQNMSREIELDMTKGELASFLGTIPETLSRILARMSKEGLIRVEGSRITIENREALQALSEGEKKLS